MSASHARVLAPRDADRRACDADTAEYSAPALPFAGQLALPAEHGAGDKPVTVFAAGRDPEVLAGYAEAGLERVTMFLATKPEDETLRRLDHLVERTSQFR